MENCCYEIKMEVEPQYPNIYIPPWGLSRESIPIYIKWKKETGIKRIEATLSNFFTIDEHINFDEAEIIQEDVTKIIIKDYYSNSYSDYDFIGIIIKSNEIIDEKSKYYNLEVKLIDNNDNITILEDIIKLFRPILKVDSEIPEITIDDDNNKHKIFLKGEKIGFGDIRIEIKFKIGGKILSYGGGELLNNVYIEVVHRLFQLFLMDLKKGWTKDDLIESSKMEDIDKFDFDRVFLRDVIQNIFDHIDEGIKVLGDVDEKDQEMFNGWVNNYFTEGEISELIPIMVKNTLVNTILNYLGKNPNEAINLISPEYRVMSRLKSEINRIDLSVQYQDMIGNEYDPIEIPIQVKDNRENMKDILIEFMIKFEEIIDNSIEDIEEFSSKEMKK